MQRANHGKRVNLYEAAKGTDRTAREAKGAPLARGVQGRTQAIMNMSTNNRTIAELKTQMRAKGIPVPRRVA
jgi:hypothetical protein